METGKGPKNEGGGHSAISLDHEGNMLTSRMATKVFSKEYQNVSNISIPRERTQTVREELQTGSNTKSLAGAMCKPITMAELKKAIKKL